MSPTLFSEKYHDAWLGILSFLPKIDLINISTTSHYFFDMAREPSLWHNLYLIDAPYLKFLLQIKDVAVHSIDFGDIVHFSSQPVFVEKAQFNPQLCGKIIRKSCSVIRKLIVTRMPPEWTFFFSNSAYGSLRQLSLDIRLSRPDEILALLSRLDETFPMLESFALTARDDDPDSDLPDADVPPFLGILRSPKSLKSLTIVRDNWFPRFDLDCSGLANASSELYELYFSGVGILPGFTLPHSLRSIMLSSNNWNDGDQSEALVSCLKPISSLQELGLVSLSFPHEPNFSDAYDLLDELDVPRAVSFFITTQDDLVTNKAFFSVHVFHFNSQVSNYFQEVGSIFLGDLSELPVYFQDKDLDEDMINENTFGNTEEPGEMDDLDDIE